MQELPDGGRPVVLAKPTYQERILVLGENGSGKSVLLRELGAAGYARTWWLDLKGDLEPIQEHVVATRPEDVLRLWGRRHHLVYRPGREHRRPRDLDEVLWQLWDRAQRTWNPKRREQRDPFVIVIDETYVLGQSRALAEIAVGLRGLHVGLWCGSQRPRNIPVPVRSEAWRIYLFALGYEEDELEVLKYAKGALSLEQLKQGWQNHAFWEIRRSRDRAGERVVTHCPPVRPTP